MAPPGRTATRAWRLAAVVVVVLAVVAVGAGALWTLGSSGPGARDAGPGTGTAAVTPSVAGAPSLPSVRETVPRCPGTTRPFEPTRISVPGVTVRAAVVTPPRSADGVPGVPPLTERGKTQFAWDRAQGTRPGDPAGNVLLNTHTWPDGSALGNRLLAGLHRGDRVVVLGRGSRRLCYRVTERVEVLAEDGLPRYYATDGPPQLAIVVCSGRRLGPGVWEKRTVWFASPVSGR